MEKVHIVCILDKSSSMSFASYNIIKSFNTFSDIQKNERGNANITLVHFNTTVDTICKDIDISDSPELNISNYSCRGMTALYDAIGETILSINDKNVYVIIQTDGEENSSKNFNKEKISALINSKKKSGWQFLFMGADIDVSYNASLIGLEKEAMTFYKTSNGIESAFSEMSGKVSNYRCSLDKNRLYPKSYKTV